MSGSVRRFSTWGRRRNRGGSLPNFLIVGTPRSGTTALARYLGAHPEVFMAPEKEVRFFLRHFDRGLDWYRSRFAGATVESAIGEATPSYIYEERAMARLHDALPEARLIVLLRNPVDRAYSHFWSRRQRGRETREFEAAIAEELSGRADVFPYLGQGRYLAPLRMVTDHFDQRALLVLLFEELKLNPDSVYHQVCSFLGVDTTFRPDNLGQPINQFVKIRSARVRAATKRLPEPLRRVIGRINVHSSVYPAMSPSVRSMLLDSFRDDNRRLAKWLGRDLSVWAR
jgi:hypothetical protein